MLWDVLLLGEHYYITLHQAVIYWSCHVCQGYVPLTLDVMRVAFKVPLAFHTPL